MATYQDIVRTVNASGLIAATNSGSNGNVVAVDRIRIVGASNAAAANVLTITNASMGQATTLTVPDPGSAVSFLAVEPSTSAALAPGAIVRVAVCGQAALAAAGKVIVQAHTSATSQFIVVNVQVMKSTGLSGNGGDRLLSLSDGTIVFNNAGITAAVLGTPVFTVWGGTGNPVNVGASSISTAGADIYLQYAGGTADYNTGTVTILVTLAQVTA